MLKILIVGTGGFIGSTSRYLAGEAARHLLGSRFPFGTLVVNIVGCLLIGALAGVSNKYGELSDDVRLFLIVGVLGGFTTYSSFGYETFALARASAFAAALLNILLQLLLGLSAVWVGYLLIVRT